jgi:hypothetical protein
MKLLGGDNLETSCTTMLEFKHVWHAVTLFHILLSTQIKLFWRRIHLLYYKLAMKARQPVQHSQCTVKESQVVKVALVGLTPALPRAHPTEVAMASPGGFRYASNSCMWS